MSTFTQKYIAESIDILGKLDAAGDGCIAATQTVLTGQRGTGLTKLRHIRCFCGY